MAEDAACVDKKIFPFVPGAGSWDGEVSNEFTLAYCPPQAGLTSHQHALYVEEIAYRYLESHCQGLDSINGRVRSPALDPAHVRPSKTAAICKRFLRQAGLSPEVGNFLTKSLSKWDAHT